MKQFDGLRLRQAIVRLGPTSSEKRCKTRFSGVCGSDVFRVDPHEAETMWGYFGGIGQGRLGVSMLTDRAASKAVARDKPYKLPDAGGLYLGPRTIP